MPEIINNNNDQSRPFNWSLLWMIVAFVIGILFKGGMGWGQSASAIDNLTLQVQQMKNSVDILTTNFNNANADTRERLKGVEDSVKNQQAEIDQLRSAMHR